VLQSLYDISNQFIMPLIEDASNSTSVADVLLRDVAEKNSVVLSEAVVALGKSYRRTVLPIPSALRRAVLELASRSGIIDVSVSSSSPHRSDRETVHDLESAVFEWLSLIKEATSESPSWWGVSPPQPTSSTSKQLVPHPPGSTPSSSHAMDGGRSSASAGVPPKARYGVRAPGPLEEILFWEEKRANLLQLEHQIYSGTDVVTVAASATTTSTNGKRQKASSLTATANIHADETSSTPADAAADPSFFMVV
jgi:hypothetical protein